MAAALPNDLVFEILTWLPGKHLCRCKCVSRTWQSMIGSSHFMETYRERQHGVLLHWWEDDGLQKRRLRSFHRPFGRHEGYFTPLHELETRGCSPVSPEVTQIINGLVCVVETQKHARGSNHRVFIHNLCTGEKMNVSNPRFHFDTYTKYHFMYDPTNGVYKVLRLLFTFSDIFSFQAAKILSVHDQGPMWRAVDCSSNGLNLVCADFGSCLESANDGVTCWLATRDRMLCFDSAMERFWFVELPRDVICQKSNIVALTKSKDRLALWVSPTADGYTVMTCYLQEDQEGKSWKVVKTYKDSGRLFVFAAGNVDEDQAVSRIGKFPDGAPGFGSELSCLVDANNLHLPLKDILGGAVANG